MKELLATIEEKVENDEGKVVRVESWSRKLDWHIIELSGEVEVLKADHAKKVEELVNEVVVAWADGVT